MLSIEIIVYLEFNFSFLIIVFESPDEVFKKFINNDIVIFITFFCLYYFISQIHHP